MTNDNHHHDTNDNDHHSHDKKNDSSNHNDHHNETEHDGHPKNYEFESAVKHEMSQKLKNFYDHHQRALLFRPLNWLSKNKEFQTIDLKNYEHPPADSIPESDQVIRTIFALQKIKTFNHHFFTAQEQRILNPLALGAITYTMWFSFAGFNALYVTYLWRTWSFNKKSLKFLILGMVGQQIIGNFPNFLSEMHIQYPRRAQLATEYLQNYGYDYFHEILNPKFDLFKLEHMHKLH